jgi:hypothetical protein
MTACLKSLIYKTDNSKQKTGTNLQSRIVMEVLLGVSQLNVGGYVSCKGGNGFSEIRRSTSA